MTSALDPISPNKSACPIGLDLLRSGLPRSAVTATRSPSYPSMMPATQVRCPVRTLEKAPSTHSDEYSLRDGSLPRSPQVGACQYWRIAASRLVEVDELRFAREQLLHGGVVQRGGARSPTLRVGLHLVERVLDLLGVAVSFACLGVSGVLGVLGVLGSFPFTCAPVFLALFGAGAVVDVGEVERV